MGALRGIRVFVSSTFRDMVADRDALMTHTWPLLRRFCRERQLELVEVDLRWGIPEEQSTRRETLKLCLDEIDACRPFFVGLLGERYGWVPDEDSFTDDLLEERPWLEDLRDRSVTELEIVHGVLRERRMHGRAFFYFRDPAVPVHVPSTHHDEFAREEPAARARQARLKEAIRLARDEGACSVRENYRDPRQLAALVLEDLEAAIESEFPAARLADPLTRERDDHESFAATRRRTYVGRPEHFAALDRFALGDGAPLVVRGDSGLGKSALLANWSGAWRERHPGDFVFQHYIGATPDSAGHWRVMSRLVAEVRRWCDDPEEPPQTHDDLARTFPTWLAKLRSTADHRGTRAIVLLDGVDSLEDVEHARRLGWLPERAFGAPSRLIVSSAPGDTLDALEERGWADFHLEPLAADERRSMVSEYLAEFRKKLGAVHLERVAASPATANPLYLKILLDELRVTGTHHGLGERLDEYLGEADVPSLLRRVLDRYERDYEAERPGLVRDAVSSIWAARRGLTEAELLDLLGPGSVPPDAGQDAGRTRPLPAAIWAPLRAALGEELVDRRGVLNFAHGFLRAAVAARFVPSAGRALELRIRLADHFEAGPVTARSCDELPWLLERAGERDRLRACLADMDRFAEIRERAPEELRGYWVDLGEERAMGETYLASFEAWCARSAGDPARIAQVANGLGNFLDGAGLDREAESMKRTALHLFEETAGPDHPDTLRSVNGLGRQLQARGDLAAAEELLRRALDARERVLGGDHQDTLISVDNLAGVLFARGDLPGAEALMRRASRSFERTLGPDHPQTVTSLNNLGVLLSSKGDLLGAEALSRKVLDVLERTRGADYVLTLMAVNNLAEARSRLGDRAAAEELNRRALEARERTLGPWHPDTLLSMVNLAGLLSEAGALAEAEALCRRVLASSAHGLRVDHDVALVALNLLPRILARRGRDDELETVYREALERFERALGQDHPTAMVAAQNLGAFLSRKGDHEGAAPLERRVLEDILRAEPSINDPRMNQAMNRYASTLRALGKSDTEIGEVLFSLAPRMFLDDLTRE